MNVPDWLHGARGAPSAHNTQPWRFTILPDGRAAVRWAVERTLPVADPTSRDLYLSLGATVESARLRGLAAGAPLHFRPAPPAADAERLAGWLVPAADAPEAARYGRALQIVTDRPTVGKLAKLAGQATAALFADEAVHAEFWRWLRLDPADPAYQRDGLTADCLELDGLPLLLARQLMPPARMRWLSRTGLHHVLAADTWRTARESAAICLLTSPSMDRAALVETGRVLQRLWLLAAAAGLTTHPLSALLDRPETARPTVSLCAGAGSPSPAHDVGRPEGRGPTIREGGGWGEGAPFPSGAYSPAAVFRLGTPRRLRARRACHSVSY